MKNYSLYHTHIANKIQDGKNECKISYMLNHMRKIENQLDIEPKKEI